MPVFTVRKTIEYACHIEAPTAEIAVTEAKEWDDSDWGVPIDEDVMSFGTALTGVRPDFTVDLQGQEHEHDFDDEDTGGCIYCDAMPVTQQPSEEQDKR